VETPVEKAASAENTPNQGDRRKAPVFVLGCPRSGTTVLYHMLLSAGDFAVYRWESNVFNLLAPRFGGMRSARDRRELMKCWLNSMPFRVSGLDAARIETKLVAECRSAGDFLRLVMAEVARIQGVERWADCTPEHLLYMEEIKRQIPNALFIHIIRDGRDVALSYVKQGWSHPLPWDRGEEFGVAGLYWEWLVRKGREQEKRLGSDYREVRFEDLVANPREVLTQLGKFIEHDLDYDRIQLAGIGSVSEPNSSFTRESEGPFNPIGRWKTKMAPKQIADFEELVGPYLKELGYELGSDASRRTSVRAVRMRSSYLPMFGAKHWARTQTPLGRLVNLESIAIDPGRRA
jgi:hypothetical protein